MTDIIMNWGYFRLFSHKKFQWWDFCITYHQEKCVCVLRMCVHAKCCNTGATLHHIPKKPETNIVLVRKKEQFLFLFCFPPGFMWKTSAVQRVEKIVMKKRGNIGGKKWILTLLREQKDEEKSMHFSFHFCKPHWISGNELMPSYRNQEPWDK